MIEGSFLPRLAGILTHFATLPARNGRRIGNGTFTGATSGEGHR